LPSVRTLKGPRFVRSHGRQSNARPDTPFGIEYRVVTCAAAEAQDMLENFGSTADVLTTLGGARAVACAVAVDNQRLALRLARILPPRA